MGKKGEATKQHIRSVAFELFTRYGYSKVTMNDICEKCGLSKGGLYRHYEDKCQLFTDILYCLQKEEADREEICIKQEAPAIEILDGYLDHIRQHFGKAAPNINRALYEFCLENRDGIGPELLSRQFQRGRARLLSLVEYGISKDEFHLKNPQGAVASILFLVEGLLMANEVMSIPAETLNAIFSQMKEMMGIKS